jgi:hypothetical protein
MSVHMFGVAVHDGRTAGRERDRREAIAQRHGAEWTEIYDESTGTWKSWFSCPNQGRPFDQQIEAAVMQEVRDG